MDERPQPKSLTDLFLSFSSLAMQGFGGVLGVVQQELVEKKRWLSKEEFIEEWAVAQIMPGPNVVTLALMIGTRYFGLPGAVAAVGGMLVLPLLVLLLMALLYAEFGSRPEIAGMLRGMGAVAAGLIIGAALKLSNALKKNPLGLPVCIAFGVATFAGIALLRWPLIFVLLGVGPLACLLAFYRLKP